MHVSFAALLGLAAFASGCDAFKPPPQHDDPTPFVPPRVDDTIPPPSIGRTAPPGECMQCSPSGCGPCRPPFEQLPTEPTPWRAPFTGVGDDGWRQSTRPLCAGLDEISSSAIWGDGRGVFVVVTGFGRSSSPLSDVPDDDAGVITDLPSSDEFAPHTHVLHNEGAGWSLRARLEGSTRLRLAAASATRMILWGDGGELSRACTLGVISGNAFECSGRTNTVNGAYAVSKTRAFALIDAKDLLQHDGASWSQLMPSVPGPGRAVWASEDELVVVGDGGNVFTRADGAWTRDGVGKPVRLTAVWGTSASDLWVGSDDGRLFHLAAGSWSEVARLGGVTCETHEAIDRIAGAGDHVWLHTRSQLARWNGSELETFANWTCSPFNASDPNTLGIDDLWVAAEDEVYVALSSPIAHSTCGDAFVVHYDGSEFHRF